MSTPTEPQPQSVQPEAPQPQAAQARAQSQPEAPQPEAQPQPQAAQPPAGGADPLAQAEKPRPRTGPILWGAVFLVFCAYVVQRELAPAAVDPAVWIAATAIGLGVLLLAVGLAVVLRNARSR